MLICISASHPHNLPASISEVLWGIMFASYSSQLHKYKQISHHLQYFCVAFTIALLKNALFFKSKGACPWSYFSLKNKIMKLKLLDVSLQSNFIGKWYTDNCHLTVAKLSRVCSLVTVCWCTVLIHVSLQHGRTTPNNSWGLSCSKLYEHLATHSNSPWGCWQLAPFSKSYSTLLFIKWSYEIFLHSVNPLKKKSNTQAWDGRAGITRSKEVFMI